MWQYFRQRNSQWPACLFGWTYDGSVVGLRRVGFPAPAPVRFLQELGQIFRWSIFPLKLKFSSVLNWLNGISTTLLSINRATCMLESNATYSHQCFAVHKMDPHPKNDILHNIFLLGFSEIPDLWSQLQSEKLIQSSEGKFIILHKWSNWVSKAILEAILLRLPP